MHVVSNLMLLNYVETKMNIKQTIMLSTFVVLFASAVVANAADEKAVPEKPAVGAKKTKPHSHAVEKGVIPPQAAPTGEAKQEHKNPKIKPHDHRKEHKGG